MKSLLSLLFTMLTLSAACQHKSDKELSKFLSTNKIDTFIFVKTGCTNCVISYEDTSKSIDILSIQLLYQLKGKQYLVRFSDTAHAKQISQKVSSLFNYVLDNKRKLMNKETYYREAKMAKFQAPCLVVFPYETIDISIGRFKHRHTLVERESDNCGTILTHYNWFGVEIEILKQFDLISSTDNGRRTTGGLLQ